jgi:hypothetical protein
MWCIYTKGQQLLNDKAYVMVFNTYEEAYDSAIKYCDISDGRTMILKIEE